MRRLLGILLNVFTVLSLVVAIAVFVLWRVSYSREYEVGVSLCRSPEALLRQRRTANVRMVQGHWLLRWEHMDSKLDHPDYFAGWDPEFKEAYLRERPNGLKPYFIAFNIDGTSSSVAVSLRGVPTFMGFGYARNSFSSAGNLGAYDCFAFPAWLSVLVLLALPGVYLARRRAAHRRLRAGRCVRCGYDLRASPQRCPECGAAVAARHHDTRTLR